MPAQTETSGCPAVIITAARATNVKTSPNTKNVPLLPASGVGGEAVSVYANSSGAAGDRLVLARAEVAGSGFLFAALGCSLG